MEAEGRRDEARFWWCVLRKRAWETSRGGCALVSRVSFFQPVPAKCRVPPPITSLCRVNTLRRGEVKDC